MPIPVLASNPRRTTYHGLEDAGQSWIEGDFLTLDATTGETRVFTWNSDTKILGLAQADASTVTSTDAPVSQIWPNDILLLDTYDSQAAADKDASAFIPGKLYELTKVSARWYAEYSPVYAAGLSCLICEGIVAGSLRAKLAGDTRYRAQFRVLESVLLQHVGQ